MFTHISIYRDSVGDIFAEKIAECLDSAKVMVGQKVVQCTQGGSCEK